jgi:hypothetical protein
MSNHVINSIPKGYFVQVLSNESFFKKDQVYVKKNVDYYVKNDQVVSIMVKVRRFDLGQN